MKLVETKTYRIDMADTERENLLKIATKLEEISKIFSDISAIEFGDCGDQIEFYDFDKMIGFLQCLATDDIEVY